MSKPWIHVAVGVIQKPDGSLLLAQRPEGKPWSGWWEFPGGKVEQGESVMQALARELKEELDIDIDAASATPWVIYTHEYPKNVVRLEFCRVPAWTGQERGLENQALRWVDPHAAVPVDPLLPAALPPLRWLRLPDRYLITGIGAPDNLQTYLPALQQALNGGVRLVQFREPAMADTAAGLLALEQVLARCRAAGAKCLVNSCHPDSWQALADGTHLQAAHARDRLSSQDAAPKDGADEKAEEIRLLGVSAHDKQGIDVARRLNADFAVLGHVLETPSHAGKAGIGWPGFASEIDNAGLPVFALGGMQETMLKTAKINGAHGIAAIRGLLN
jgi:8-oxo-dGTP diphosphatase